VRTEPGRSIRGHETASPSTRASLSESALDHERRRWGFRLLVDAGALESLESGALPEPASLADVPSARHLKSSRGASTFALDDGAGGAWIYKLDRHRSLIDALKHFFRPSRARRAWRALRRLAAMGFDVPELAACGEKRRGPFLSKSFLVTRAVPGARTLAELLDNGEEERRGRAAGPPARQVLALVARTLRRLHDLNVFHPDLNPANFLISPAGRLVIIDADRARFLRRLSWRRRVKNLSQLNAHLERRLSLGERLRLLRLYAPEWWSLPAAQRRRRLAAILRMTRRRWQEE
jgi:tRNA A-37 threonylcarbamoyl transferase component Bud32